MNRHPLIDAVREAAAGANGARGAALAALEESGLPGPRDEAWRFTPLKSLDRGGWSLTRPMADVPELEPIEGLDAARIVFVDGYPAGPEPALPDGVELVREERSGDAVEPGPGNAFELLSVAAGASTAVLRVSSSVERPLHVVHHSTTSSSGPRLASPRLRVELATGAALTVVEDHVSEPGSQDLVNLDVELVVGANARVEWTRLARAGDEHRHLGRMRIRQERDSVVRLQAMTFGGALVRHDVSVDLEGSNAECALHGLVVGGGRLVADNHSVIRHCASHARSSEHFRNVLDGQSRAVFAGRVVVSRGVTGTDARQSNANLLLGDDARVDALPQLEIYNDDVKASHGSTLGRLDTDAMFYLRSRGIDEATARAMLTWAFANVVVEEIGLAPVRNLVRREVFEHLPAGAMDEAVLEALG